MKTLKTYLALMIVTAYTTSCSNDDGNTITVPPPQQQTSLINKVVHSNSYNEMTLTDIYEYDDTGKLTSLLTNDNERTYSWNADGKINKATINTNGYITITNYFYNSDGNLQKIESRDSSNTVFERREFTYYSDRYEERFYTTENELLWIYKNYYSADGNNIMSRVRYYSNGLLFETYNYVRDSKVGLEKIAPFSMLPKPFYNENNVIEITHLNNTGGTQAITEYPMTYNGAGYPITATTSPNYTDTFSYIHK